VDDRFLSSLANRHTSAKMNFPLPVRWIVSHPGDRLAVKKPYREERMIE
jgi:hypothetical protein